MSCTVEWLTSQDPTRIDQTPGELGSIGQTVTALVSHPNSDLLVIGTASGSIIVWDPAQASAVKTLKAHNKDVTHIVFPNGTDRFLTVSIDGFVQWWSGSFQREQGFSAGCPLFCAAASPSGRFVAAGGADKSIRIWDTLTGELAHVLKGHADTVTAMDWASDSVLVTGGSAGSIRCWEVDVRRCFRASRPHRDHISRILTSPTRLWYLTASWDGTIKFWTLKHKPKFELPAGPAPVTSVALCPGRNLLAASYWNGTTAVWNIESGAVYEEFRAHEDNLIGCAVVLGGQWIVTADQTGELRSWALSTMGVSRFHNLHTGETYALAYSPDNTQAISAGHDGQLKVWDRNQGTETASLDTQTGPILSCAISPDKRLWALGTSPGDVRIWNSEKQSFDICLSGHKDAVSCLAFLPHGQHLITGSWDMKLKVWSLQRQVALCTMHGHSKEVAALDVSLDGRMVVSASWDSTARVWDLGGARRDYLVEIRSLTGHEGRVLGCAFSPDGGRIATAGADQTVRIWQSDKAVEPRVLHGHHDAVTDVRYSPDGQFLISVSRDGNVNIWGALEGIIVGQLKHDGPILSLAIAPDGRQAMIGDETGHVRFFLLNYKTGPNWVAPATTLKNPPIWKRGAPPTEVHELSCIYCGFTEVIRKTQLGHPWKCPSCGDLLLVCPKGLPPVLVDVVE